MGSPLACRFIMLFHVWSKVVVSAVGATLTFDKM